MNPPDEKLQLTKRNFLRKIAMLFDPTGFLAPYVIRAKILLQEMSISGLDWDDPLDPSQVDRPRSGLKNSQSCQTCEYLVACS